jgi:transposase
MKNQVIHETTTLFDRLLGLHGEWRVTETRIDEVACEVVLRVSHPVGLLPCPECGVPCKIHDRAPLRRWRHLDACDHKTVIECEVPRIRCAEHKVKTVDVPWSEPHGRFTVQFEAKAIGLLKACQCKRQAAKELGLSFDELHGIQKRAVFRGLLNREEESIERIGLDEKSMKKGHNYMTVLTDIRPKGARVLEVAEHRTEDAAAGLLRKGIPEKQRSGVLSASMDMWGPYEKAVSSVLPGTDIVFDRFHVSAHLGNAVDLTRRGEMRRLSEEDPEAAAKLKGCRHVFLYAHKSLPEHREDAFLRALKAAEKTAEAWMCKEVFRAFWDLPGVEEGRIYLANWIEYAEQTGIPAMRKVAGMLRRKTEGLLNYLKHRVTNATAESLNAKIQLLKSTARGYRAFENYRINILFHFGQLNMLPLKTQ